MKGRKSYGKRIGGRWKNFGAIKSKLREADRKLETARKTILQEDEALKEPDYDPGTDLQTEANRINSAREDIDKALKLIDKCEPSIETLADLQAATGKRYTASTFPYSGIKDELSGVEKDIIRTDDPTYSKTYLLLQDPDDLDRTAEIWSYDGPEDNPDPSTKVFRIR